MTDSVDKFYEVSDPLPDIPDKCNKEKAKEILTEYAIKNNFILTVCQSSLKSLHFKCKKGGTYKNWRKLSEKDRQRQKKSTRTGCPFYIRLSKKKETGYQYLTPRSKNELLHNHSISEDNSFSTSVGRKSKLTVEDLKKVKEGIDKNLPTKTILKSISSPDGSSKLTIHDINNIKYAAKIKFNST